MNRFGVALGFSVEARQVMSQQRVVRLDGLGSFLRNAVFVSRQEVLVGFPVVGAVVLTSNRLDALPKLAARFLAARTDGIA